MDAVSSESYKPMIRKALRMAIPNFDIKSKVAEASSIERAISAYREAIQIRLKSTAEDEKEHVSLLKKTQENEKRVRLRS